MSDSRSSWATGLRGYRATSTLPPLSLSSLEKVLTILRFLFSLRRETMGGNKMRQRVKQILERSRKMTNEEVKNAAALASVLEKDEYTRGDDRRFLHAHRLLGQGMKNDKQVEEMRIRLRQKLNAKKVSLSLSFFLCSRCSTSVTMMNWSCL